MMAAGGRTSYYFQDFYPVQNIYYLHRILNLIFIIIADVFLLG